MNHVEKARELFLSGYNCAQAVAGAFADEVGLPEETMMRLSSSFGGGMGGMRETCGAVTGMFMVAGLLFGYEKPGDDEQKKAHYARIRGLAESFKAQHDTVVCRELLAALPGKLQSDPSPRTAEYYKVRPCVRFVEDAAALLEKLIEEAK
ncbi:MAG: C_GCAxxG_C_C family protein [Clostridia bacterium]|nr:C_GCAxxG_C_C family protein [Clostridia bacterium]